MMQEECVGRNYPYVVVKFYFQVSKMNTPQLQSHKTKTWRAQKGYLGYVS